MRKKLFINVIAEFPDTTHLSEELLSSIEEDISDAVLYNGEVRPSFVPLVEMEVR